jgi:tRNA (guanine-N7-)-methyltransferase
MKDLALIMVILSSSWQIMRCASAFHAPKRRVQTHFSRLFTMETNKVTPYTISCPPTHPDTLYRCVSKHVLTLDQYLIRKPIAPHTVAAFQLAQDKINLQACKSIILDSGCGTGRSSLVLGEEYPDSVVLGVDRSLARLERNVFCSSEAKLAARQLQDGSGFESLSTKDDEDYLLFQQVADNVWLIRAELVDFWRCARQEGIVFDQHYLLYPNPYPKKARVQHRWYAHPSFPMLLQSSPHIVVRSNWEQYLQEMATAVQMADQVWRNSTPAESSTTGTVSRKRVSIVGPHPLSQDEPSWTNFEEKYRRAGEATFELELNYSDD